MYRIRYYNLIIRYLFLLSIKYIKWFINKKTWHNSNVINAKRIMIQELHYLHIQLITKKNKQGIKITTNIIQEANVIKNIVIHVYILCIWILIRINKKTFYYLAVIILNKSMKWKKISWRIVYFVDNIYKKDYTKK